MSTRLRRSTRKALAAALCGGLLALSAASATASLQFGVLVNTAPLIGNANGPFSLDFQLIDGSGTNDANNTATISNFVFGTGNATGTATAFGGATGDLSSSVTLTDSDFFNEFYQAFTPGATLSFLVTLTSSPDAGSTPDAFSFSILDGATFNIPTTGLGDSLLLVNIDSINVGVPDVQTFRGTGDYADVSTAAVPEPESAPLLFLGMALLGAFCRRQRNARK